MENVNWPELSKKERRRLKKELEKTEVVRKERKKRFLKLGFILGVVVLVTLSIAGLIRLPKSRPPLPASEIVSRNGLHWHPEISILILGQKQKIPANIGMSIVENPIHTHDNMGVIHLEFSGLVKKDDIRVGKFFEVWGKKFNKDCIFDKCNGAEGQLKMFVNAKENSEFENYSMRDGDKIAIIFR